jgi:hypothetical protein
MEADDNMIHIYLSSGLVCLSIQYRILDDASSHAKNNPRYRTRRRVWWRKLLVSELPSSAVSYWFGES